MNQPMSFGLAGNSVFAEKLAAGFVGAGHELRFGVSLPRGESPTGARSLRAFCEAGDVPYYEVSDLNSSNFINTVVDGEARVDFLVVSWPQILRPSTLSCFPLGVVGSHPTPLPWGRGRHPLHWIVAMGMRDLTLSLFLMDQGVDTGGLLGQSQKELPQDVSIAGAIAYMDEMAYPLAHQVGLRLAEDGYFRISDRPPKIGSYWRQRSLHDATIDFRMSVDAIRRLVQSFSAPFPGARIRTQHGSLSVLEARRDDDHFRSWRFYAIGSVLACSGRKLSVRADDGVVTLTTSDEVAGLVSENDSIPPPSAFMGPQVPSV